MMFKRLISVFLETTKTVCANFLSDPLFDDCNKTNTGMDKSGFQNFDFFVFKYF